MARQVKLAALGCRLQCSHQLDVGAKLYELHNVQPKWLLAQIQRPELGANAGLVHGVLQAVVQHVSLHTSATAHPDQPMHPAHMLQFVVLYVYPTAVGITISLVHTYTPRQHTLQSIGKLLRCLPQCQVFPIRHVPLLGHARTWVPELV